MILRCGKCKAEAPEEAGFCLTCGTRFVPRNAYDLQLGDFAYSPDRNAIETLKITGPLPYLVKSLTVGDLEKRMYSRLSQEAHHITHPSALDSMIRKCAMRLALDHLPDTFVIEEERPNAFAFGTEERASIVVNSGLLQLANEGELRAVFGHELGHVKSGHMLYHTLAEALGGGISLSASFLGLDILSIPIQLALLSWHRESEITADRASLLVVQDVDIVQSILKKLASSGDPRERHTLGSNAGVMEAASELLHTHPLLSKRLRLVKEFANSGECLRAEHKIELQQKVISGLLPFCRFCGGKKIAEELFCPSCRRSQL